MRQVPVLASTLRRSDAPLKIQIMTWPRWRTCAQPDGDVQRRDIGGGGADCQTAGGEDRAGNGDGAAPEAVDEHRGDGPDAESDAAQDGGDEGDRAAALAERLHQLDDEDAEGVGDAVGCKEKKNKGLGVVLSVGRNRARMGTNSLGLGEEED